jgi:RimJ/RimL family protein N-acetyltransferase
MGGNIKLLKRLKDGTEILIREGIEDDAVELARCVREYVRDGEGIPMVDGEFTKTEAEEREWIRGMRENPSELLLVAIHEGRIVGNIDFHIGKRKRTCHAGEFGMGILPAWRSRGLGTVLLEELLRWAEANPGVEKVNLRALSSNARALGLYRKLGFFEEGRRAREINNLDGSYDDDVLMGRFVKPLPRG